MLQAELNELHVKGICRPVAHSLWHAIHHEPDVCIQLVCNLLSGVCLSFVLCDFLRGLVLALLSYCHPERLLPPGVLRLVPLRYRHWN